jgi:hypothetical protein
MPLGIFNALNSLDRAGTIAPPTPYAGTLIDHKESSSIIAHINSFTAAFIGTHIPTARAIHTEVLNNFKSKFIFFLFLCHKPITPFLSLPNQYFSLTSPTVNKIPAA